MYEDDAGRVVGFMGVSVRRFQFDGRPIRLACVGPTVWDPQSAKTVGPMLLRNFFGGPQEISICDGSNDPARRMADAAGAQTTYLGSISWTRPLRPAALVSGELLGDRPRLASALRPLSTAADRALLAGPGKRLRTPAAEAVAVAEELTPATMLEHLPSVMRAYRCHPDYDEAFLGWVFAEMERVRVRGRLVRSLLRDGRGRLLGWYIYYLKPGGVSWAIQVAATRGQSGAVLDHLFQHAATNGAAAVSGRAEPHLLEAIARRRCVLRFHGGSFVHAKDPALLAALLSKDTFLTLLEGEWWMGPHLELS